MPVNRQRVEHCIEAVCRKGCRAVWADIAALEASRPVAEASDLSAAERRAVIDELKSIMAVYEGTCLPGDLHG